MKLEQLLEKAPPDPEIENWKKRIREDSLRNTEKIKGLKYFIRLRGKNIIIETNKNEFDKMRLHSLFEESTPNLKNIITPDIKKLGELFKSYGEEIRIVGGAVRDALLEKSPKDIDLATTATPDKMLEIANDNNIRVIETGLQHGTVTFVINGEPYEITTLRVDTNTDGRHASVDWTKSFKEDARRRDLTYNAMSIDMNGKLHDYFGGLKDLRSNNTSFVGDSNQRIQEDYLRILRYFRFLAKHPGQKANQDILKNIKDNVKGLENISGERIWMELSKMVTYPNMANALKGMCEVGIGKLLNMVCNNSQSIEESERISKESNNPITILAPMFANLNDFVKFANHLKIPNEYKNLGLFLMSERDKGKYRYIEDIIIGKTQPEHVLELSIFLNNKSIKQNAKKAINAPAFPINGNDLMKRGMKPGPSIGQTLDQLKREWINSDFKLTKKQLLKNGT